MIPGFVLLDQYGLWNMNSDPDFDIRIHGSIQSRDEQQRIRTMLGQGRGPYLKTLALTEIEVSPFTKEYINSFKINDVLDVVSTAFPGSDTRHYYPVCKERLTKEIIHDYVQSILEVTYPCLRYQITESSIIALTESDYHSSRSNKNVTHSRWEFHFDFFQSWAIIPLFFEDPSRQVISLGNRMVSSNKYQPDGQSDELHPPIKDVINLIDRQLIDLVNLMTIDQVERIEDHYQDYLHNWHYDIAHDKSVKKFQLLPYHINIINLLWRESWPHQSVSNVIEHVINISVKIERLSNNLIIPYLFEVNYYYNNAIITEYERT